MMVWELMIKKDAVYELRVSFVLKLIYIWKKSRKQTLQPNYNITSTWEYNIDNWFNKMKGALVEDYIDVHVLDCYIVTRDHAGIYGSCWLQKLCDSLWCICPLTVNDKEATFAWVLMIVSS